MNSSISIPSPFETPGMVNLKKKDRNSELGGIDASRSNRKEH